MKAKYRYSLAFEDVNENLFDEKGILRNREAIDLYWTLPNSLRKINEGIYGPFIKHILKIQWSKIKFRWKIILQALGLWK